MNLDRQRDTLEDVVLSGIRGQLMETHTALPGIVQAVDLEAAEVDVRVAVRRIYAKLDGAEDAESWPILQAVPVWQPHAGGFHLSLPVAVGDECLILFAERDISRWLADGTESTPETRRLHHASDAVVLVGLNSTGQRVPLVEDQLGLGLDNGTTLLTITTAGEITLKAETKIVLDTPLVEATGDITATGEITAGTIPLKTHKHLGSATAPTGGISDTGLPKP